MTEVCSRGTLYVVATPIGNLGDITMRAVEVLKNVQTVAAEDTRRSRVLLEHIDARPRRVVSLHEFNEASRLAELLDELQRGHDVALVSDAGTPLVSDPGFLLVRECWQRGIRVSPVPGPSALTAVLSASPLRSERVLFLGFLPSKPAARVEALREALESAATVVFFEAPHRLVDTLRDIENAIGERRRVLVAKEVTKVHERWEVGTPREVLERLRASDALDRGEFVCVIEGMDAPPLAANARHVVETLLEELPPTQAARLAAKLTGEARGDLYAYAVTRRAHKEGD